MKAIIAFLLCCASVLADEGDIRVFSVAHTNSADIVYAKDEFTRDGQTNLVRIFRMNRQDWFRVCRFYHAGEVVGNYFVDQGKTIFNTEAGIYCMGLSFGPAGEILSARIGNARGMLLDEFTFTNGTFSPVSGPLRVQMMKPRFVDEDKFIKESAEAEGRLKRKPGGKEGGPTAGAYYRR
jgi:hypothetical protein